MKRIIPSVVLALVAGALAFTLSGCDIIGIGDTGSGTPQLNEPKVSTPVISEEGILRVGVNAGNAPFSTLLDDKMVGIDVDIAAALANELGLTVKMIDVGADPEGALKNGTVDVVLGMDSVDTSATCWRSDPYLSTAIAIFATSTGAILPTEGSNVVIEAQESSMSAWEISNQFGEEALKAVKDLKTVFDDLESGATTYGAADAVIGSYVSHTSGGKAQIIGLMQKPGGYCMGVNNENEELKSVIAEAVKKLCDSGVIGVIESKWMGSSLNLGSIALTASASKATDEPVVEIDKSKDSDKKESELGDVGGNAVELQDDGSQPGESAEAAPATDGYWGYTYDQTYNQTYDPNAAGTAADGGYAGGTDATGGQGYVDGTGMAGGTGAVDGTGMADGTGVVDGTGAAGGGMYDTGTGMVDSVGGGVDAAAGMGDAGAGVQMDAGQVATQ